MTAANLRRTPLHDWHVAHRGRMVEFAGYAMPVQYKSIVDEHHAVRRDVGLFDVSHMGRWRFDGGDIAAAFLDRMLTRRADDLPLGKTRYALVANELGGVKDDVLVSRIAGEPAPFHYLVVNAGNREKLTPWFQDRLPADGSVRWTDESDSTAMIALQGPRSTETLAKFVAIDLGKMAYYSVTPATIAGVAGLLSRTGYTGELGYELIVPAASAVDVWSALVDAGATPAGLGARDTLRLEAGMPLYGHELLETITPFEADLGSAVELPGREFVGRDALAKLAVASPSRKRVGLALEGKRPGREGCAVLLDGRPIGQVTSGTFSPTLDRPIAMALIETPYAAVGQQVAIDIRGQSAAAVIVSLPFYRRAKKPEPGAAK